MRKIKKLISLLLVVLTIMSCIPITAFASTDNAKVIDSTFLFDESSFDDLKLNFNSLPEISVSGISSDKYKIYNSDKTWWMNKAVENRRIEFIGTDNYTKTLNYNTHYPDLKLVVTYSNCGTLNGKNIDVVLTYSDFWTAPETGNQRYDTKTLWWTAYGTPEQQDSDNEWFAVGFSKYNFDIKFRYHNNSSFIDFDNAYFTLYSMDGSHDENYHYTHSEAAASETATNVYWYKTRQLSYNANYTHLQGYNIKDIYFGTAHHTDGNRDTKNALCFQYQDVNSINLDMIVCFGLWSEGYHVNFTPLTATIPKAPTKTANMGDITAGSTINYTISQQMPKSFDEAFSLTGLSIIDKLDKNLEYVSASVQDDNGNDITSVAGILEYSSLSHKVTYTFNEEYLKSIDYNGQSLTFNIITKVKEKTSEKEIDNSVTSIVNDSKTTLESDPVVNKMFYPVLASYMLTDGTEVYPSQKQNVYVGNTYRTSSLAAPALYSLVEVKGDETGVITDHPVFVDYIYDTKDYSVTAKYVDEEGNELETPEVVTGEYGSEYVTKAKDIEGYELTTVPNNATGTFGDGTTEVVYVYKLKDTSVLVNYIDDEGTPLTDSITITGKVFDKYSTEQKEFYGYRLTAVPANATGTMAEEQIVVNYVYTKKSASVTVNYLNEDNEVIAESETLTGNVGDKYTTTQKDIEGYTIKTVPDNSSGSMTEEQIIVNYIYKLKDSSVLVNYITENGTPLTDSVTLTGKVFDKYDTEAKEFYGYELTAVPDNASGEMTEEQIVVNYIYKLKDTSVVVNYVDEDNNPLVDSITISGKVFDKYSTEQKEFYGYELTAVPDNASGEMTEEQIVVNYIYKLKDTSVIVNYVDEDNNPLADSITKEGKVFDEYSTEQKKFYGYELTAVPDNASGEMTEEQIVVNYIYKLKDTSVLVNYITEDGTPLTDSITLTGKVFDKYETEEKTFKGYELTAVPENASGEMTEEQIVVNYIYRLKDATVVVNYITEDGQPMCDAVTITGKVFDEYETEEKSFTGYELTAMPENASGTMSEETIVVNYIYKLKDASVLVQYVDDKGTKLTDDVTINGKCFEIYTTEAKDFYGYTLTETPFNASGRMGEEQIIVTYVYTKSPASVLVNYVDEDNNPLTDSITISGKVFDKYSSEQKEFYGYELTAIPENASGEMTEEQIVVNYIYKLKDTSVVVNYVDEDNNPLVDSITISGKVFDKYSTEQKEFYGYELTAVPDNASGEMTEEQIVVNYIYKLKDTSVVVNYITEDGQPMTDPIIINGKVNDNYTTEAKTFTGYELTAIPDNATGTMAEEQIVVNYIYKLKDTSVIVQYIDEEGTKLTDDVLIKGKCFEIYSTDAKDFYGYYLTEVPFNAEGRMGEEQITVTYIYAKSPASVVVNYKTEDGKPLTDSVTLTGKVFDKYDTEAKEFYGYELTAVPDNASGEMTEEQIVVNYIYKLKDTSVVVNYVDEDNNPLVDSITISGKVFDKYSTEQKEFYGYELTAVPDNASGEMTEEQIVVNYIYKLKDTSVLIQYVDKNGNKITEDVIINGKVFDEYSSEGKELDGYKLITVPDNANGEMTEDQIVVTYIYEKIEQSVSSAPDTGDSNCNIMIILFSSLTILCAFAVIIAVKWKRKIK